MNDTQIRETLQVMARGIEIPDDLATRTIVVASRKEPRRSYRRWYIASGALAAAVTLFVVGTFVTARRPDGSSLHAKHAPSSGAFIGMNSNDAVAGQVAGTGGGPNVTSTTTGATPLAPLPSIVKTAEIHVQVKDFEKSWPAANDIAPRDGGYVTNTSTSENGDHVGSGTMTIRVPSTRLDDTLKGLRGLGTMTSLTSTGADITSQMNDLKARLRNAQAEESQLVELMNNAGNLSDVLDVRNRLNQTRGEIESLEGQINSNQDKVDFSTVTATVFEKAAVPGKPIFGTGTLAHGVRTGAHLAVTLFAFILIALGALLPLAALVALGWFVRRIWRERTT